MAARPHYYTWCHQPRTDVFQVASAEHDEFVLSDGRRVYDFVSTSFQASFGHSHPAIVDAIERQLRAMPIASPKAAFDLKQRVSERLIRLLALDGGRMFYTVSGSEAVENALKMARQITGRTKVLARRKSYHGATLGALSVTGDWRNEPHFTLDEHTVRIPEPADDPQLTTTREIVDRAGGDQIAAIILETISGTNGVAIPSREWFDAIASLCHEHGIMLIIDEVLCGFGRTGSAFAFHDFQLQPDFVCMSKAISGGYVPFGAVWTGRQAVAYYETTKLACGLTNYGHPLGLAATDAVLHTLADESFRNSKTLLEQAFAERIGRFESLACVGQVRCRGLLAAIEVMGVPAPTWETMFAASLHAFSSGSTIVLAPPFISTPARLNAACDTLAEVLTNSSTGGN